MCIHPKLGDNIVTALNMGRAPLSWQKKKGNKNQYPQIICKPQSQICVVSIL